MKRINIDSSQQRLELIVDGLVVRSYIVSTASNGMGEANGSFQTPRGRHQVCAKIGHLLDPLAVLVARRPTGEIYSSQMAEKERHRDWILGRILWLSGLEKGQNLGGNVDTRKRYIYIHGSPPSASYGEPGSRGCIRMRPTDIVNLFESIEVGAEVYIS